MKTKILPAVLLVFAATLAAKSPQGTVPLVSADKYHAHAEQDGSAVGATLLSPGDVRKVFKADVPNCCLVVEVAVYPKKDGMLEVSLDDFVLRVAGQDIGTRPASAEAVDARLRNQPVQEANRRDTGIHTTNEIGYETGGIDPVTGQRRPGGVYTRTGVGVGVPAGGGGGRTEPDPRALAIDLREKGLPEGNTMAPVSGYVYFVTPKKKKSQKYQLEYMLNGAKVVLPL